MNLLLQVAFQWSRFLEALNVTNPGHFTVTLNSVQSVQIFFGGGEAVEGSIFVKFSLCTVYTRKKEGFVDIQPKNRFQFQLMCIVCVFICIHPFDYLTLGCTRHAYTKYTSIILWPAMQVSCYTVPLQLLQVGIAVRIHWGYSAATPTGALIPCNAVAAEYHKVTPTYSSHSGSALYEMYKAGQRNVDVYKPTLLCLECDRDPCRLACKIRSDITSKHD